LIPSHTTMHTSWLTRLRPSRTGRAIRTDVASCYVGNGLYYWHIIDVAHGLRRGHTHGRPPLRQDRRTAAGGYAASGTEQVAPRRWRRGPAIVDAQNGPHQEVDDHARKQVNGLAVLSRRDLDDLGLGQGQPERPPRPTLPSRPSVHACTTSGPPSTRRPLDRITQPPRHRDRRDSVHQPRTLPLSDAHRSIRVRDRSVVSRGHAIRTQSRPRAVTVRHPITGHNNPDHHGKLLASCGVFA
jgi:hypothetical protein